ncbi:MAG: hypothetical protein ACXVB1_17590 [Pseudobdellovibrionaceae bacterium]
MRLSVVGLGVGLVFFFSLVGCKEVDIKDGHVPQEYLPQIKQLEGKYKGNFDGKASSMEISFEGDRPFLKYTDSQGHELLEQECHSKVNLLKMVILGEKNDVYVVDQASFEFDPGDCDLEGRTLELIFSGSNQFTAKTQDYSEHRVHCTPGRRGTPCNGEEKPHYLTGKFSR